MKTVSALLLVILNTSAVLGRRSLQQLPGVADNSLSQPPIPLGGAQLPEALSAATRPEYFLAIRDGQFVDGCNYFNMAGWNQWEVVEAAAGAPSLSGATIPPGMTGPELVRTLLNRGAEVGFNTMRTWVHPVNRQYALQTAPGEYNEAVFRGLDYLLDEARKAGIKLILAFTSNWTPTGGIPEYLTWFNATEPESFYTDPAIKQAFKDFMQTILTRTNTINGRVYSEDPTVAAWNLLNEPRCQKCEAGTVSAWYTEMAEFVKSLDSNHLLSTGEEGFFGESYGMELNPGAPGTWASEEGQDFIEDHASPNIDFATMHMWIDNWGDVSLDVQSQWIDSHVKAAGEVLQKPILMEEWGKWYNLTASPDPATLEQRNEFMSAALDQMEALMSEPNSPLQGSLFWQWYYEGQEAAPTEGGGRGLFGIYESDDIFARLVQNAQFVQSLNGPVPGCDPATAVPAEVPPVPDCSATWINGVPGTGMEGPDCMTPIDECVRGTAGCDANAACINSPEGFECRCYLGFQGDGAVCTPDPAVTESIVAKYWSEPDGLSCKSSEPVPYPEHAPGWLPDTLGSFAVLDRKNGGILGSKYNVTLEECMVACEQAETCEHVVYNDVLLQCFLSRGACPVHNYCQGEQAKCTSTNDRGGQFEFDCGFWTSYYRLDSDVSANCENFQPKVDAVGEPNVEVVNVFAEWKAANPTAPVRSTPVEVSAEVLPQAAGR